ncbi:alpha/beta fold hydrolase [Pseudonocardia asaccharolytica]|uniref:Peptidase n=1 Tax=Pseudonocardia asaccharolytica DSM 44247 = NBRC 16224 TaxID=1123024 RepID=A0A511D705_9PSEU|nr:alpha/beta fold hydrolase [Pseudonocardia asaccharolytica]GEL20580.1 peptidase [Pseudonocardia asaccharolytica DSM 44247 = NBRC 16224]
MSPAPQRALLVGLSLVVAVLAGCTVGPSQRPPVAVRGETVPPPPSVTATAPAQPSEELPVPEAQHATIPFADCTADTLTALGIGAPATGALRIECGEISVPTDPDQPGLGRSRLGVVQAGAADAPATRPPLLVVGDTGTDPSARHAARLATQVSPEVLARYRLVGLDRRGSGVDALDCAPPVARAALIDADRGAGTDDGLTALLEQARGIVQSCYLLLAGEIGSYRTASTAADIEELRGALGVRRLSAIGVGDGAAALAGWANAHPEAVGRLVLDGPLDPALDQPELSQARAGAAEETFDAFATTCTATGTCPLGPDPRGAVTTLVERLRAQPLATADGRRLTAGITVNALLAALSEPRGWPQLATALGQAVHGDPDALLAMFEPVAGSQGRFDAELATSCNDAHRRLTPPEVGQLAARWSAEYPLFGGTFALRLLACAPWPAAPAGPATGPAAEAPPILVLGTAHDPRAPLAGAKRAADSLRTARFAGWQGSGTGAYPRTPCISGIVDRMLVDGMVPQTGTVCPP